MRAYFAVVGLLCLVLAVWLAARRLRARFFGAVAIGTVAGQETRESDGSTFHLAVVGFVDAAGVSHRFTSVAGGVTGRPAPGARVTVRYLPSKPGVAYVSGFLPMWAAPVALFALGLAGLSAAWQA